MNKRNTYFKLSWVLILSLAIICISYPGSKPAYFYKGVDQAHACDGGGDGGGGGSGSVIYYRDADGDGYGNLNDTITVDPNETPPSGYVIIAEDCDDNVYSTNPGAAEVCDGVDNNCDGQIDEGVKNTYYRDADEDTYGDPNNTIEDCTVPSGYVSDNNDCDDTDKTVYPGAPEVCDCTDHNCDEDRFDTITLNTYYLDQDKDDAGDMNMNSITYCTENNNVAFLYPSGGCGWLADATDIWPATGPPDGYVTNDTDCNDFDDTVYLDASEVCDCKDNNCSTVVDDNNNITFAHYCYDGDGNKKGDPGQSIDVCITADGTFCHHFSTGGFAMQPILQPDYIEDCTGP